MIPYVGDLSRADAELLRSLACRSTRILEFGAGASTQIFATYGSGVVYSVEMDPAWIERTARNLKALRVRQRVDFRGPHDALPFGSFDLIFIDSTDELRAGFAFCSWKMLAVGGKMCFHDTRRTKPHGASTTTDVQNVCAIIERHSSEIDSVVLNQRDSNITVVTKRAALLYEDWNVAEERTLEQIGLA
jgi:predicted O-methyltransferase YrrM